MLEDVSHLSIYRNDANEGAIFARQLEVVKTQTYDIEYPNLRGRDFVPVDNQVGAGATSITYDQFDRVGRAKIISNNAKDIPRVDITGKEFTRPVRPWADAYGWTIMEVQSAALAGRNLNAMKAEAARRAIEEGIDETASIGAPEHGIPFGFINSPDVPVTISAGLFSALSPDAIVAEFSKAYQRMVLATNGIHKPTAVILPDAEWALIATTPRSTGTDTTILDFILKQFPFIQSIESWYRLTGAGTGGTQRMISYDRSPMVLTQDITQEFTQLPVQEQGLEFVINALAQTAGVAIYRPLAIDYTDTI